MDQSRRKRQADILRWARKIHRTAGAFLFVFFFITACTGLLLGWKKHTGGVILSKSYQGKSSDPRDWLPMHLLQEKAVLSAREHISPDLSLVIDRFDVRPDKGMVKFIFVQDYWGVQIDCTSGEVLHIERRRSDLIENIHDGSILDRYLGLGAEPIKVLYTSVLGTALLTFTTTGFWLWYGPKRFRSANRRAAEKIAS